MHDEHSNTKRSMLDRSDTFTCTTASLSERLLNQSHAECVARDSGSGRVLIALEFLSTPLTSADLTSDGIMSDTWNDTVFLGERRAFVSFTGRFSSHNVFQIGLSRSDG